MYNVKQKKGRERRRRRRRRRRLVSTLDRVEGKPFCAILSSWALINSDEILVAIIKTLAQADWLEHEWFITHSGPSFCCPLFAAHTATEEAKRALVLGYYLDVYTCLYAVWCCCWFHPQTDPIPFSLSLSLFVCVCVSECDRTFVSAGHGSRNGTFTSPFLENIEGHVRQCLFTFVAAPGERVLLTFSVFNLRGTPPE